MRIIIILLVQSIALFVTTPEVARCDLLHVCCTDGYRIYIVAASINKMGRIEPNVEKSYDIRSALGSANNLKIIGVRRSSGAVYFTCDAALWEANVGGLRRVTIDATCAALAPSGNEIAITSDDLRILAVRTGSVRTVCDDGFQASWSSKGDELATVLNDGSSCGAVFAAATGKLVYESRAGVNPCDPFLSPDGRYLGIVFQMSRPVRGDTIFDIEHKGNAAFSSAEYTPPAYLPAVIEDWSPDSKWMLWDWRVPDPKNDGAWLRDDVGLTSFDSKYRRIIGPGTNARFAGKNGYIIYLRPRANRKKVNDLVVFSRNNEQSACIARNVVAFVTY